MKNEDLLKENIQLILNYNERSIVIEMKKYKTLEDIKDKVYDLECFLCPVKGGVLKKIELPNGKVRITLKGIKRAHVLEYVCYYVDKKIAWRILDCRQ